MEQKTKLGKNWIQWGNYLINKQGVVYSLKISKPLRLLTIQHKTGQIEFYYELKVGGKRKRISKNGVAKEYERLVNG